MRYLVLLLFIFSCSQDRVSLSRPIREPYLPTIRVDCRNLMRQSVVFDDSLLMSKQRQLRIAIGLTASTRPGSVTGIVYAMEDSIVTLERVEYYKLGTDPIN